MRTLATNYFSHVIPVSLTLLRMRVADEVLCELVKGGLRFASESCTLLSPTGLGKTLSVSTLVCKLSQDDAL